MGWLSNKLEELTAQVNMWDGGKTASTVRNTRNQAPPAQTSRSNISVGVARPQGTVRVSAPAPTPAIRVGNQRITQSPTMTNAPGQGINPTQTIQGIGKGLVNSVVQDYKTLSTGTAEALAYNTPTQQRLRQAQNNLQNLNAQNIAKASQVLRDPSVDMATKERYAKLANSQANMASQTFDQANQRNQEVQHNVDPVRNLAALGSIGFDIATLGVGTGATSALKVASRQGVKQLGKRLAIEGAKTGLVGAASGALSPYVTNGRDASLKDVAKGAAYGAAVGAVVPGISYGASTLKAPTTRLVSNVKTNMAPLNEGGFIELGRTPKRIHQEDQNIMADFIDYTRGTYKPDQKMALQLELDASRIAERYGLKMPPTLQGLADVFDKRLQKEFEPSIWKDETGAVGRDIRQTDPLESLKQEARTVEKFGWKSEATPQGTKLINKNGKHVATITEKKGRYTASYTDGTRIATSPDANKLAEDVARKTFYAQELPQTQNTGGTLRPDVKPTPYKNNVWQSEMSPERTAEVQSKTNNMKASMEFDKTPTPKKAYHSTASLEIEGGKLRASSDGVMGEGVYLHTDPNTAKYAGAMQADGNIADQQVLDINLKTDNLYKWADQNYPTSEQLALIKKRGYDGVYKQGGEIVVFDPNKIELSKATQSQPPKPPLTVEKKPTLQDAPQNKLTAPFKDEAGSVGPNIRDEPLQNIFDQNPLNEKMSQLQAKRVQAETAKNAKLTEEFKGAELPEFKTKQTSKLDKVFRSTRSIIERQGESGKKLGSMLQSSRDTQEIYLGQLQKSMPTVTKLARKGKNALVNKDFENFIDATQGLAKPKNKTVVKAIEEWKATHPSIRQRAVDAGLDVGDLGDTYYPHFIDYDRVFKDKNTYNASINHLVETGQAPNPEEAIRLLSRARDISRNREFGNLEASRLIDLPFYDKTPNSLVNYLNSSAKRIAQVETFGKGDDEALKLIAQAGQEGFDTEAMKNAFDVAVGAKQYSPTVAKASGNIRKYVTTTRLGLGALTNVSQTVNTGIVTGHLRTLNSAIKQLDPKTRNFVQDTGVISEALLNDFKTQYGFESFGQKVLGKAINKVTAPGFQLVEKFNRSVAATAGRDYALRLAQKGDEKTLRKLGVTGEIKGKTLTEPQQIQAARKIVEKTQFKVDPQDLPGWTDSPGGKLVAQFRTFSYNQGKFFSNEILKPAAKGNVLPLGRMLAALPVGYALYEARRVIDGRPEEENKTKVALSSFQKIGGAGLAFDLYQSLNPLGSNYLPSDRRVSMAVGAVGGPAVGVATQAVGALSEGIQRKNTPKDPSRLEGKLVVGNTGDSYTDATPLARFGLQQIPIVGTPIKNRLLPFEKESNADTGRTAKAQTPPTDTYEVVRKAFTLRSGDLPNLEKYDSEAVKSAAKQVNKDFQTELKSYGLPTERLKFDTVLAKDYADFKKNIKGKNEIEVAKQTASFLKTTYKGQYLDDSTKSFYNLGDNDMRNYLNSGKITKKQMDSVIELDNLLTKSGLQKYPQVGKILRSELGYGLAQYSSSRSSGSGRSRSGGRSRASSRKKYRMFGFDGGIPVATTNKSLRSLLEKAIVS